MAGVTVQMAQTAGVEDKNSNHHDQPQPPPPQQTESNKKPVANTGPSKPDRSLIDGDRENYLKVGVPLYEAAIRCDWNDAYAILEKNPEFVRYSITENGETALHIAASAKGDVEDFVRKLVNLMTKEDLELSNKYSCTALYLAAAAGNIKTVKIMVEKNTDLLAIPGNGKQLPLYVAAFFGNYDVVRYLYKESKELSDDCWDPENRRWLLQRCVENDMFDIALEIVKKHPDLASGAILGILARKPKAFAETNSNIKSVFTFIGSKVGAHEKDNQALLLLRIIWKEIAKKPKIEIDTILRGPEDSINQDNSASGRMFQVIQLQNLIYDRSHKMEVDTENIIKGRPVLTTQDTSNLNYSKVDRVLQLKRLISEFVVNMHTESQKIVKQGDTHVFVGRGLELQKLISKHIMNMHEETQNIMKGFRNEDRLQQLIDKTVTALRVAADLQPSHSSRTLFIAAEMGNTTFLVELIRQYPDLIWKVNDSGLSIFHIAIIYRHEGIFKLLHEIGAMKDLITPLKDKHANNMLHLVGTRAKQKQLDDVSGVALQLQRELLWFKEVKKMIPPYYRERKNGDGLTPHELFTMEHKELVTQGEKWMKDTSSQCMVVAALIATIVFAAAFTVPGGYDQNNGIPMFHSKATFMVFVVADAISLVASCASILIFLSILTSRYAEIDFLESLPNKLTLGILTLFLSITTMTVAFGVSFFVLYHKGLLWMPILICVFGVLPVLLYIYLQYGLFSDVIRSTYRSRYLFKPQKRVLYYKNPKV